MSPGFSGMCVCVCVQPPKFNDTGIRSVYENATAGLAFGASIEGGNHVLMLLISDHKGPTDL